VKSNSGPPVRAVNSWPFSTNSTVITEPAGPGVFSGKRQISRISESSNTESGYSAASWGCESNRRNGVMGCI
jgi:hypothetical protein